MVQEFHRDYLVRLPLPLAQLYSRAHNAKDARGRHDNTFYLFEALVKLTAAPGIAAYLHEIHHGAPRIPALDQLLCPLALPSLGQWVAMMRGLARHFGERPDAASHPLGHVWMQLNAPRRDLPGLLALFRRIKNGPDSPVAGDQSCTLLQVIEALVQYRNAVFGHGASRSEAFYEKEMGPLLFPAADEILAEGVLDLLGPRGSRLVYLTEMRTVEEGRVEVGMRELAGLQGERRAPLLLGTDQVAGLAPQRLAVLWPGRPAPLRLDPLLLYRESELADEVLFLNRDRNGKQVEYLSYTTGRTERDRSTAPALAALLSRITGRQVTEAQLEALAEQSVAETASVESILGPSTPVARRLGDYEILAEIGRGGMGVVYLARQLSLGRLVGLKMLPADLAGDEVALARFRREVRALARCEHPNIVKVLSSGTMPDGQLFYTMEYVPGCDLESVWREVAGSQRQGDVSSLGTSTWAKAVLSASRKRRETTARGQAQSSNGKRSSGQATSPPEIKFDDEGSKIDKAEDGSAILNSLPLPPLPELPSVPDDPGGYVRHVVMLVRDAALALQTVHQQQIVHRDVKPGNLMLTPDGNRIVLMDFGLAKGQSLTMSASKAGGLLGTLRYAAPEQLAAASLKVGPPADVRGLGVTLWELLTRQRLFGDAEDEKQLAVQIHDRDVPLLRKVDPTLDRDLEAIVARATERAVQNRIKSAGELATYLQLFLERKPLPIRPPTLAEMVGRWVRSHKLLVGSVAAGCVVILATVATAFVLITASRNQAVQLADFNDKLAKKNLVLAENEKAAHHETEIALGHETEQKKRAEDALGREAKERQRAEEALGREAKERQRAEEALGREAEQHKRADAARQEATDKAVALDRTLYFNRVALAEDERLGNNLGRAQQLLDLCPPQRRGWEWNYVNGLCHAELLNFTGHHDKVYSVAFSPNGKLAASASGELYGTAGEIKIWQADNGKELRTYRKHLGPVHDVLFTPDSKRIISSSGTAGEVRIWDVADGHDLFVLKVPSVHGVALTMDGKFLATGGEEIRGEKGKDRADIKIWDTTTGQEVRTLTGHTSSVSTLGFSPDGKRLVSGTSSLYGDEVKVWNVVTGKEIFSFNPNVGAVFGLAYSPDGNRIACCGYNNLIGLFDARTGRLSATLAGHTSSVVQIKFSPDGERLASASWDQSVKMWDVGLGQELFTIRGHTNWVSSVAFSPDSKRLASGSWDHTVKVWDALTGRQGFVVHHPQEAWVSGVAINPDNRLLAAADLDFTVKVWDLKTGRPFHTFPGKRCVAFSPDGNYLAAGGKEKDENKIKLWDLGNRKEARSYEGHTSAIQALAYSPDGKRLASSAPDGVRIWDTETAKEVYAPLQTQGVVNSLSFSADGKRLASGSYDRTVVVWDVLKGQRLQTLIGPTLPVDSVAFSPDGHQVAAATGEFSKPGDIVIWDVDSGKMEQTLTGHADQVTAVVFTPDGRLISASYDKTIKVWDVLTGQEFLTLRGHGREVLCLTLGPDGKNLASGGRDGTVRVWGALVPD